MIKIYGNVRSRANRCFWLLAEIGAEYENVDVEFGPGKKKSPEYLKLNPSGKVPTMVDDKLVLFESIAINLYLAKTYGKDPIWLSDPKQQALILQWSFWAVAELEPYVVTMAVERFFKPEPARDLAKADEAEEIVKQSLPVLEHALQNGQGVLVGDRFSVADLNVAAILTGLKLCQFDFSPWPEIQAWLDAALSRPAYGKAMGR